MKTFSTRARALILACLTGALILGVAVPAFGHATVQKYGSSPAANGYGAFWIRIGHGCEDKDGTMADTQRVVVVLPGAFQSAKPQQLAGWKASVTSLKAQSGYRIQWVATAGPLSTDAFQDFGISVKYPAAAGLYDVPTVQHCGALRTAWVEHAAGGVEPDFPVPTITVASAS